MMVLGPFTAVAVASVPGSTCVDRVRGEGGAWGGGGGGGGGGREGEGRFIQRKRCGVGRQGGDAYDPGTGIRLPSPGSYFVSGRSPWNPDVGVDIFFCMRKLCHKLSSTESGVKEEERRGEERERERERSFFDNQDVTEGRPKLSTLCYAHAAHRQH
jgi:hypothetical protein